MTLILFILLFQPLTAQKRAIMGESDGATLARPQLLFFEPLIESERWRCQHKKKKIFIPHVP